MNDRLRALNGKLVIHSEAISKPPIPAGRAPRPYLDSMGKSALRTSPRMDGGPSIHIPIPVYPPYFKRPDPDHGLILDGPHDLPYTICISPPRASNIRTMDTWTEICEDLCRAMEVLSVLSDLDSDSLDPSPSMTSLDCSVPSSYITIGPGLGDHWHSYVFPRLAL